MDLSFGSDANPFRAEVRGFVSANWTDDPRRLSDLAGLLRDFRLRAIEAGYLYRSVPRIYGGSEQPMDVLRAHVIREEFARARAPMEVSGNGTSMLIPTLLECGTEEQKRLFIPATISGEMLWAQGYSEPSSGSDLASVRTRGELLNGEWVINGHKTWTSDGGAATHMFALVRTEPLAAKHAGLSYLLIDLEQPGVVRRPIRQMNGRSDFYEMFLDDVTTPASWIVGARGEGWSVSRATLRHERASIGSADVLDRQFAQLLQLAKSTSRSGGAAIRDPAIRQELARIEGWVLAHRASSYRLFSHAVSNESTGLIGLMMKLLLTEIGHETAALAAELIGDDALIEPSPPGTAGRGPEKWSDQIAGSLGMSIAGGTTNIQRNIIAERGLGLPRDPAMEADR